MNDGYGALGKWTGAGKIIMPELLIRTIAEAFSVSQAEALTLINRIRNPATESYRRAIDRRIIQAALRRRK